ncbi:PREDICTED: uncharacterized protein LOC104604568 [Nelumbo nucifera]|uniref:Uncharacterized protein LOC104604568 n=2 Tax=Nelumbo nucifera TaxID=4432 RepID=A0A1U8AHX5_NELNU|nr:PREDICTED: uncharacterized protein LOC104604568 [Nelumbo nucifera]DAD48793.1 TPA_asm: hypothetical protein HUJ06_018730 [Nelumbo nucifera]
MVKNNNKNIGVRSSTPARSYYSLCGVRAVLITRRNSPQDLILRRLRRYLLYCKLRSLIPPNLQLRTEGGLGGANGVEVEHHETQLGDSSDEENCSIEMGLDDSGKSHGNNQKENHNKKGTEEDDDQELQPFVPSIKFTRFDSSLLISTVVLKDIALTSVLFHILEEEKLAIVSENQYRTETKVSHTVLVRVKPDYDVDELEKKLCRWAGKPI